MQDYQLIEKLAHQNRERIPERGAREGMGRLRNVHRHGGRDSVHAREDFCKGG